MVTYKSLLLPSLSVILIFFIGAIVYWNNDITGVSGTFVLIQDILSLISYLLIMSDKRAKCIYNNEIDTIDYTIGCVIILLIIESAVFSIENILTISNRTSEVITQLHIIKWSYVGTCTLTILYVLLCTIEIILNYRAKRTKKKT